MTVTAIRLTPRLQLVYDHLITGEDVWDFCCDHGYLGEAAHQSRQFKDIYFVDRVASIMERLEHRFKQYPDQHESNSAAFFVARRGQDLEHPVRGTACIMGVGGHVIYDILNSLATKGFLKAQRLILGPHRDGEKLLAMVKNNRLFEHYKLTSQKEVTENNRTRLFFIFDQRTTNDG